MRILLALVLIFGFNSNLRAECAELFDTSMRKLHSKEHVDLCELTAGKPVLVVNTASHCGFTKQFKGLEALHRKYQERGLVVLGFSSDSFFQENNDESKAAEICYVNFGVTFTMLASTPVRGSKANSVFKALADQSRSPSWNFNKYLVNPNDNSVQHFGSRTSPEDPELVSAIESVL
jgi:glutathione peroxidase